MLLHFAHVVHDLVVDGLHFGFLDDAHLHLIVAMEAVLHLRIAGHDFAEILVVNLLGYDVLVVLPFIHLHRGKDILTDSDALLVDTQLVEFLEQLLGILLSLDLLALFLGEDQLEIGAALALHLHFWLSVEAIGVLDREHDFVLGFFLDWWPVVSLEIGAVFVDKVQHVEQPLLVS